MTLLPGGKDVDRRIHGCKPAAGLSDPQVLDFEGLRERCMGNLDLVQRVLEKFEQRLPEELAELERVLELEDPERIAQVAHRIKGNSANISAQSLRQAASDIEDLSRAGRLASLPARVDHLRRQWERYLAVSASVPPAIQAQSRSDMSLTDACGFSRSD